MIGLTVACDLDHVQGSGKEAILAAMANDSSIAGFDVDTQISGKENHLILADGNIHNSGLQPIGLLHVPRMGFYGWADTRLAAGISEPAACQDESGAYVLPSLEDVESFTFQAQSTKSPCGCWSSVNKTADRG